MRKSLYVVRNVLFALVAGNVVCLWLPLSFGILASLVVFIWLQRRYTVPQSG